MDGYKVLGVDRTLPLEEVETRYRTLLREAHPDLHRMSGPAAIAEAEACTRQLTAAIEQVRHDYARAGPGTGSFGEVAPLTGSFSGVWNDRDPVPVLAPVRERKPVLCPHCAETFVAKADFAAHLDTVHPDAAAALRSKPAKAARQAAAQRRHRRSRRRWEGVFETIAACIAVVGIAAILVARSYIGRTGQHAAWIAPTLAVGLILLVLMLVALIFMRKS